MTPDPSSNVQLRAHVFTTPLCQFGDEGKHWSPCASTLVTGETEVVLTDTGHIKSEVSALGDMIEQTGKRLTTIYITHGHLDHFLGIGQLMKRFPDARPVATPAVVADIKASVADQEQQWQRRFGDEVDSTAVIPQALEGDVIDLEGQELRAIEVPQGDIAPSTIVHIPSIDTVIGGDVVYNRIHMTSRSPAPPSGRNGSRASTSSRASKPRPSSPGISNPTPATRTSKRSSTAAANTSATSATPSQRAPPPRRSSRR